jgi:CheY-like chemotaxis protein
MLKKGRARAVLAETIIQPIFSSCAYVKILDGWHTECFYRPVNVSGNGLPLEDQLSGSKTGHFGKEQILIAEDDPTIAQDLKYKLEHLEHEVAGITDSAEEAIVLAERLRPDLVLMDIQLAGEMDGIQAAEQIRTLRVPIVYVSGYCDGPVLERAQRTEPYGYVLKPYRTDDLRISVEMSLQRHRAEQERERLLQRFNEVLASVKTLTGRLSICCYCKKIRDEAGDWPDLETYVMKHSHASFTHGMCPDCFTRLQKRIEAIEEVDAASGSVVLG